MYNIGRKVVTMDNMNLEYLILEDCKYYVTEVRQYYSSFDLCHDEKHFDEVYNEIIHLTTEGVASGMISLNVKRLAIAAAAYHDIGRNLYISREPECDDGHEARAVEMITYKDDTVVNYLHENFSKVELEIIKKAILEHRSKAEKTNEISKLVKDADNVARRNPNRFIQRVVGYNFSKWKKEYKNFDNLFHNIEEYTHTIVSCPFSSYVNFDEEITPDVFDEEAVSIMREILKEELTTDRLNKPRENLSRVAKKLYGEDSVMEPLKMPSDEKIKLLLADCIYRWFSKLEEDQISYASIGQFSTSEVTGKSIDTFNPESKRILKRTYGCHN
jgi:hypothetical protein